LLTCVVPTNGMGYLWVSRYSLSARCCYVVLISNCVLLEMLYFTFFIQLHFSPWWKWKQCWIWLVNIK